MSVELVNVKHLELMVDIRDDHKDSAYSRYVCRLIEACSSLEKLVIKVCINVDAVVILFNTCLLCCSFHTAPRDIWVLCPNKIWLCTSSEKLELLKSWSSCLVMKRH